MRRRYNLAHSVLVSVVGLGLTPLMVVVETQAQIAFVSHRDGHFLNKVIPAYEIYVMDADGGNQLNLTNNPNDDSYPSWSPDGKRIAFASYRDNKIKNFIPTYEIYVMDADGSNPQNLTNDLNDDKYPSWSPDGKRIAFASERDENWDIYVMDADGGNLQNLTNNRDSDVGPAWYVPAFAFAVAPAGKTLTMWGRLKQVDR